jgi:hypothetical protein
MWSKTSSLVADAYQVIGELLDSVGGDTRLDVLGVVGDEESLLGLDDDETFLALVGCQFLWYENKVVDRAVPSCRTSFCHQP